MADPATEAAASATANLLAMALGSGDFRQVPLAGADAASCATARAQIISEMAGWQLDASLAGIGLTDLDKPCPDCPPNSATAVLNIRWQGMG
ncbi:MAG: hypothetical protein LBG70_02880, partial [Bifidobacteriaceae bacterium]|nr:hypothetical protein [Bifidobacteriaceae bacterium]